MNRLVWAKFQGMWWPAFYYSDVFEFNGLVTGELDEKNDQKTKARLAFQMLNQHLAEGQTDPNTKVIRFLGRPVCDFQYVDDRLDDQYKDFFAFLPQMMLTSCRPENFNCHREIYLDFHRGFDEATSILHSATNQNQTDTNMTTFVERAKRAWNDYDHHQQRRHHHQMEPAQSPMANNSVAAVSLAEESTIASAATPHTYGTAASSPPQDLLSPPPLDTSPIRGTDTWNDVWGKLAFSGWTQKRVRHPSRPQDHEMVYFKPNDKQTQYTLEQVQSYAQQKYGWHPRTTRNSTSNMPSNGPPAKKISFGVLWKSHLAPQGWKLVKSKGNDRLVSDWCYIKPGKTLDGVKGEDWFLTDSDVMEYCRLSHDYPETSSSEGETTSPETDPNNEHTDYEDDNTTLHEEDDNTTLHPLSEAEDSYLQTPRESFSRPQDPQKPRHRDAMNSASSSESVEDEETRYNWKNLWSRLKNLGWYYKRAQNPLEDYWYFPPKGPNFESEAKKDLIAGKDYFNSVEAVISHIRKMDGLDQSASKDVSTTRSTEQANTRRKTQKVIQAETKKTNPAETKKAKKAPALEKGTKRPSKSSKSNSRKKQKVVDAKDVTVRVESREEEELAPWTSNPLTAKLHPLFLEAGFTFNNFYYLPNESHKEYTERFVSSDEVIQHLSAVGCSCLQDMSPVDRSNLERVVAYAHVPEKNVWRQIRAITTVETIAFLGVLGYTGVKSDGSWKVPDGMAEVLHSESFESLSALVLALRKSPILTATENKRRRGSSGDLLTKDQMLALRLRIAEGLDGETWSDSSGGESSSSEQEDQEEMETEEESVIESTIEVSQSEEENEDTDMVVEDEKAKEEAEEEERYFMEQVDKLCTSVCSDQEAWTYLQQLGCKYSSGYSIPSSDVRFENIQDLVQHIFAETICCLDQSKKLSRVAAQRLHRWLKFRNVRLTETKLVINALKSLNNTERLSMLLDKIGIKANGESGYYLEKNGPEEPMGVEDIINLIRTYEDLTLINVDETSRSRRRDKSISISREEELTLRIWAAESEFPLPLFDEDFLSSEMEEDDEEVEDEDTGDTNKVVESSNAQAGFLTQEVEDMPLSQEIEEPPTNDDETLTKDTVEVGPLTQPEEDDFQDEAVEAGPTLSVKFLTPSQGPPPTEDTGVENVDANAEDGVDFFEAATGSPEMNGFLESIEEDCSGVRLFGVEFENGMPPLMTQEGFDRGDDEGDH